MPNQSVPASKRHYSISRCVVEVDVNPSDSSFRRCLRTATRSCPTGTPDFHLHHRAWSEFLWGGTPNSECKVICVPENQAIAAPVKPLCPPHCRWWLWWWWVGGQWWWWSQEVEMGIGQACSGMCGSVRILALFCRQRETFGAALPSQLTADKFPSMRAENLQRTCTPSLPAADLPDTERWL